MRRIWLIISAAFLLILIALLAFLPYGVQWYLEKYDHQLIGRELLIEDVAINPFTGRVALENLQIMEQNGSDVFLSFADLSATLVWLKLFSRHAHLRELKVEKLQLTVQQKGVEFNFDDLLSDTSQATEDSTTIDFTWRLDSLHINKSQLLYLDLLANSSIQLDSVQITIGHITDTTEAYNFTSAFQIDRGQLQSEATLDTQTGDYNVAVETYQLPLHDLQPYLTQFIHLNDFGSDLSLNLDIAGNYLQSDQLAMSGQLDVQNFVMKDTEADSLLAWQSFSADIDTIDFTDQRYEFGTIQLNEPYIKLVNTTKGDNFSQAMVVTTADSALVNSDSVTIASEYDYTNPFQFIAQALYRASQDYLFTNYLADSVLVKKGELNYWDYTLQDTFQIKLNDLVAKATNITSEDNYARFAIQSDVNNTGKLTADLQISRNGVRNMIFDFKVDNIYLHEFNPYSRYYMAHPFADGKVIFNSKNTIEDYYLDSRNNLFVEEINVGEKDTVNALYQIPMKLAVALLKDLNGNVDLDIPVEGQLDDPKYKLWRTVLRVLRNILLKVVTAPYKLLANAIGGKPQDLKSVSFDQLQYDLFSDQTNQLKSMAKLLNQKPDFNIRFIIAADSAQEKDQLAVFNVWQQWQSTQGLVSQDSSFSLIPIAADGSDSLFVTHVQKVAGVEDSVTQVMLSHTCRGLVGEASLDSLYQQLWQRRQQNILDYFIEKEQLDSSRYEFAVTPIHSADSVANRPQYKVEYFVN